MSLAESREGAPATPQTEARSGFAAALLAYGLWGFLPILFHAMHAVDPLLIVAERSLWSLLLVGIILRIGAGFSEVRAVLADRRKLLILLGAAVLLAGNWLLYVWAVGAGLVLEASFGYFINPLVNVAMGIVLLKERLSRWQTLAILVAAVAIGIQAAGIGSIPFVALGLAVSFAIYGYIRKTVGVSSTAGLFVETLLIAPAALALVITQTVLHGPGPHADPMLLGALMLTGPATAVPLLMFAYAVKRLKLSTIGMLQYISPSVQFFLAIGFFGEHLSETRLLSFALIWVSLAIFTIEGFVRRKEQL